MINKLVCSDCGQGFINKGAVNNHKGSMPCRVSATERHFKLKGWVRVYHIPYLDRILKQSGVPHEFAPAAYIKGFKGKSGSIRCGYYAPPWVANTLRWTRQLQKRNKTKKRIEFLSKLRRSKELRKVVRSAYSLGGEESALSLLEGAKE